MSSSVKLYYKPGVIAPSPTKIKIPFQPEPISIKDFKKNFKEFARMFDGTTPMSFLNVYWKFNKLNYVFEFTDLYNEVEVGKLMWNNDV